MAEELFSSTLSHDQSVWFDLRCVETQVSLQDKLWQFFVEAEEFSFLNFSSVFSKVVTPRIEGDPYLGNYLFM